MTDNVPSVRVAIVIPCYNESARLPSSQFEKFLAESPVEFVFVDDGSTDKTYEVLNRIRATCENRVTVLRSPGNQGKAEAVRSGINHAFEHGVDYVGFWDADLATPLTAIREFMVILVEQPQVDMVFGARVRLLGRHVERRAVRHYAGRIFATIVSSVLRIPIYDTQCGAKIFRCKPEIQEIFGAPFLSRWVFDVELIARYILQVGSPNTAAKRIYEYPLHAWADISGSRLKAMDFAVAFWDVVRIYWKYMRKVSAVGAR